ncbi:MAG: hypothetical protein OXU20_38405 [Myxococcales bacterium]|nr:hypothetical protein [Myxococcales bacterium]
MRMWLVRANLMAAMAAGLLFACAESAGTETGNPPLIALNLVHVAAADETSVEVIGEAGAITPGGGEVTVENERTGDTAMVAVADDGSFMATLHGTPEDHFALVASNDGQRSEPQVIRSQDQMGGDDWQTLHACKDSDPMDPVDVNYVELDGDTMDVGYTHLVACGGHKSGLCWGQGWAESDPIQLEFRVLHDASGDDCDKEETEEASSIRVDLAPFRAAYAEAYQTDSGAARISLAECSGGSCSVVYRWGDEGSSCQVGDPDCPLQTPPADWSQVDTPCPFTLTVPDDLVQVDVQGTDSCTLQFESDECVLSGDYGPFSDSLTGPRGGDEMRTMVSVDGFTGTLVTARADVDDRPYFGGLNLPVDLEDSTGVSLTLTLFCDSVAARTRLLPVLGSVQF